MNLRDLEYLVALADARSFRQAARDCDVSQPTLSAQIKKLETDLGVVLFDRSVAPLASPRWGAGRRAGAGRPGPDRRDRPRLLDADAEGGARGGHVPTLGPYLLPHVVAASGSASRR